MSLLKKQLNQLRLSFSQVIKGFILFILSSSGLGFAIILRYLNSNGTIIAFGGILVEAIAIILIYFLFRKYFKEKKESTTKKDKKSQFYE
ncbi:MAG: hypothetical protein ACFE8E_02025 [Candidatus Hodarchaeota archaeon]